MNEATLQAQIEDYLKLNGFVRPGSISDDRPGHENLKGLFFHIPNQVFQQKKTVVNLNLKNLPDLIVLRFDGEYLASELKVGKNKLMRGQRAVRKIIPVSEMRNLDEFDKAFKAWMK